eukprot:TRINITY_DN28807_c0_g1_i1.p1 TRINITY_DN28807_c0_g1~~TRINITY_DN28807_c0_g1_i1.p1  ORF type:complete len:400 (+),score=63.75 TRINITY_DN28807_c0_g1_i1:167-1366(+)
MPSRGAAGNSLRVASLLSVAGAATCPAEWFPLDGTDDCYRAFEGPLNWDDAKVACEEKGAVLTSIHSKAENDHAIWTCGNTRPFHQGCWIGGTDRKQTNRRWIWVDGSAWDWSKWFDHGGGNVEPNNDFCSSHTHCTYGHTADCNVLEVSGKVPYRGYWLDTFCSDRQKFICKIAGGEAAGEAEAGVAARRLAAEAPGSSTDRRTTMQSSSGQELPSSPPLPSPPLPRSPPLPSPPPSLSSAAAEDLKTSSALPESPPLPSPPPQATTTTTTSTLPPLPSSPPTIPSPPPQTTTTTTLAQSQSLPSSPPAIPLPPQDTSITTTTLGQSRSLPSPPPPPPSLPSQEATTTTPLPQSESLPSPPPEPPLPPPAPPEPPPLEFAAEESSGGDAASDEDDIYQ